MKDIVWGAVMVYIWYVVGVISWILITRVIVSNVVKRVKEIL